MANENVGVAPPDIATHVGQVRLIGGDSTFTPLEPPVAGQGSYSLWSDLEIEAALLVAGDSVPRAIAMLYTQLAGFWNSSGATIKTDDLTYSAKDSVGSWMALAKYWNEVADAEEERAANDYFDLVEIGAERYPTPPPELAPWPWSV